MLMNSKSVVFSIVAVAAVIALFASGPLVASAQAFPGFFGGFHRGFGFSGFHHFGFGFRHFGFPFHRFGFGFPGFGGFGGCGGCCF